MKKLLSFFMAVFMMFCSVCTSITAEDAETSSTIPPIVVTVTANSVVLAPIIGYEYRMGDGEWQTRNLFTGLTPLTEYVFYQRDTETGEVSEGTAVITDKPVPEAPPPPEIKNYGEYSVVLVGTPGYEYKRDDGEWQSSASFPSDFSREHRYYQRVAESEVNYASESSEALVYTLEKLPARELVIDDDMLIEIYPVVGWYYFYNENEQYGESSYQFRIDGGEWSNFLSFGALEADTEYTVYIRWKPNAAYYPSEEKEFFKFRTLTYLRASSDIFSETYAPKLIMKSDTSLEIQGFDYQEYIVVDTEGNTVTDWQDSFVFTGLSPDTEYILLGRWKGDNVYKQEIFRMFTFKTMTAGETYYPDKEPVSSGITANLVGSKEIGDPVKIYLSNIKSSVDQSKLRYVWYRNGVEMEGVTGREYTPTIDDLGCSFTVKIYYDDTEECECYKYVVNDYIFGDVNGDLIISLTDAAMTLKHIAKWDVDGFNEKAADYRRDSFVNLKDVSKMLQTIAGWQE